MGRANICASLDIEEDEFANDVLPCLVGNDWHDAYVKTNRGVGMSITPEGLAYLDKTSRD